MGFFSNKIYSYSFIKARVVESTIHNCSVWRFFSGGLCVPAATPKQSNYWTSSVAADWKRDFHIFIRCTHNVLFYSCFKCHHNFILDVIGWLRTHLLSDTTIEHTNKWRPMHTALTSLSGRGYTTLRHPQTTVRIITYKWRKHMEQWRAFPGVASKLLRENIHAGLKLINVLCDFMNDFKQAVYFQYSTVMLN